MITLWPAFLLLSIFRCVLLLFFCFFLLLGRLPFFTLHVLVGRGMQESLDLQFNIGFWNLPRDLMEELAWPEAFLNGL